MGAIHVDERTLACNLRAATAHRREERRQLRAEAARGIGGRAQEREAVPDDVVEAPGSEAPTDVALGEEVGLERSPSSSSPGPIAGLGSEGVGPRPLAAAIIAASRAAAAAGSGTQMTLPSSIENSIA
jgi:hypothetical protein